MTFHVVWAPAAVADFEEILDYITLRDGPEAAERVASRILARIGSLKNHPRRCRIVPELKKIGVSEYRESILAPYRVFFRLSKRTVGVIGLLDGRRDLEEVLIRRYLAD